MAVCESSQKDGPMTLSCVWRSSKSKRDGRDTRGNVCLGGGWKFMRWHCICCTKRPKETEPDCARPHEWHKKASLLSHDHQCQCQCQCPVSVDSPWSSALTPPIPIPILPLPTARADGARSRISTFYEARCGYVSADGVKITRMPKPCGAKRASSVWCRGRVSTGVYSTVLWFKVVAIAALVRSTRSQPRKVRALTPSNGEP